MENPTEYRDAKECLQAAQVSMRRVKSLISQSSVDAAEESAALLRDVEIQLGCVAAILGKNGAKPDAEIRAGVHSLQNEVAVLASFFSGADKMLSGWLGVLRTDRGGYTARGHAAPLVLVKKLSVEG